MELRGSAVLRAVATQPEGVGPRQAEPHRTCQLCSTVLSRYNPQAVCSVCERRINTGRDPLNVRRCDGCSAPMPNAPGHQLYCSTKCRKIEYARRAKDGWSKGML